MVNYYFALAVVGGLLGAREAVAMSAVRRDSGCCSATILSL